MKTIPEKLFDKRIVNRNIDLKFVSEDDYQKYVQSLPDDTDNFDTVSYEDPEVEAPTSEASAPEAETSENSAASPEPENSFE